VKEGSLGIHLLVSLERLRRAGLLLLGIKKETIPPFFWRKRKTFYLKTKKFWTILYIPEMAFTHIVLN